MPIFGNSSPHIDPLPLRSPPSITSTNIPDLPILAPLDTTGNSSVSEALPKRLWYPKARSQSRKVSDKSHTSAVSSQSNNSNESNKTIVLSKIWKLSKGSKKQQSGSLNKRNLGVIDPLMPVPRLTEALDLAPLSHRPPTAKQRRATKAALALRTLILDPNSTDGINHEIAAFAVPGVGLVKVKGKSKKGGSLSSATGGVIGKNGKKISKVPPLREIDVERLRTQLLKPEDAKLVIKTVRALPVDETKSGGMERAVCLDCNEDQADLLIVEAKKIEKARIEKVKKDQDEEKKKYRFSTVKKKITNPLTTPSSLLNQTSTPTPPRLPVLLSLWGAFGDLDNHNNDDLNGESGGGGGGTIMALGLFEPASAMSLHRPLAGALPSADTLRRGFDALINAESKVYLYQGPSHKNIYPPLDRISVYTYWWGFELALPPPTMAYLAHAKSIATSVLNLLSVIVYAVPGGTRELAPFVGVLSRFIDNEWALLKSQDQGKGVVCGATWFIPAALVARPWDFGEETIRDKMISEGETKELEKPKSIPNEAKVKVKGEKGEAEGVVIGIGRGVDWNGEAAIGIGKYKGEKSGKTDGGERGEKGDGKERKKGSPLLPWNKKKTIEPPVAKSEKGRGTPIEGKEGGETKKINSGSDLNDEETVKVDPGVEMIIQACGGHKVEDTINSTIPPSPTLTADSIPLGPSTDPIRSKPKWSPNLLSSSKLSNDSNKSNNSSNKSKTSKILKIKGDSTIKNKSISKKNIDREKKEEEGLVEVKDDGPPILTTNLTFLPILPTLEINQVNVDGNGNGEFKESGVFHSSRSMNALSMTRTIGKKTAELLKSTLRRKKSMVRDREIPWINTPKLDVEENGRIGHGNEVGVMALRAQIG